MINNLLNNAAYLLDEGMQINQNNLISLIIKNKKLEGNTITQQEAKQIFNNIKKNIETSWNEIGLDEYTIKSHKINAEGKSKLLNCLSYIEITDPGAITHKVYELIHDLGTYDKKLNEYISQLINTISDIPKGHFINELQKRLNSSLTVKGLTPEQTKIWLRVKTIKEFNNSPKGYKWVYAVDADGKPVGCIDSNITRITMHHCGNAPTCNHGDIYYELRDKDNKAYVTVILNNGDIQEAKSLGNAQNMYINEIADYVKWFYMSDYVKGIGYRYDYGYSPHTNLGVKDLIDDTEFVDWIKENKPNLIGVSESLVMLWKTAIADKVITLNELKELFINNITNPRDSKIATHVANKYKYDFTVVHNRNSVILKHSDSRDNLRDNMLFSANNVSVMFAICGGNPFTEDEIKDMIQRDVISCKLFANYDVSLLTDRMQRIFLKYGRDPSYTLSILINIMVEVLQFYLSPKYIVNLYRTRPELSLKLQLTIFRQLEHANLHKAKLGEYIKMLEKEKNEQGVDIIFNYGTAGNKIRDALYQAKNESYIYKAANLL